jgi:hypothetical protein
MCKGSGNDVDANKELYSGWKTLKVFYQNVVTGEHLKNYWFVTPPASVYRHINSSRHFLVR